MGKEDRKQMQSFIKVIRLPAFAAAGLCLHTGFLGRACFSFVSVNYAFSLPSPVPGLLNFHRIEDLPESHPNLIHHDCKHPPDFITFG